MCSPLYLSTLVYHRDTLNVLSALQTRIHGTQPPKRIKQSSAVPAKGNQMAADLRNTQRRHSNTYAGNLKTTTEPLQQRPAEAADRCKQVMARSSQS